MSDIIYRDGIATILRPLERADVPTLRRWTNDPEVTLYLNRTTPVMEREEEQWVDGLSGNTSNIVLGMVEKAGGRLIGTMGLHSINWQHRTATTGTLIGDKAFWGKGHGTDAKMLLLDVAFNALDLYAIQSKVYAFNTRSLAYGRKCGYVEAGRLPKWMRAQDGVRYDEVLLVVTQETWRPLWLDYVKRRDAAAGQP